MQSIATLLKIYFYFTIILLHDCANALLTNGQHEQQHIETPLPLQRLHSNGNLLSNDTAHTQIANVNSILNYYGKISIQNGTSQKLDYFKNTVMNQNAGLFKEDVNLVNDVMMTHDSNSNGNNRQPGIDKLPAVNQISNWNGMAVRKRLRRNVGAEDVCDNVYCHCDKGQKFMSVHCRFSGVSIKF